MLPGLSVRENWTRSASTLTTTSTGEFCARRQWPRPSQSFLKVSTSDRSRGVVDGTETAAERRKSVAQTKRSAGDGRGTSNLDSETDAQIQLALAGKMEEGSRSQSKKAVKTSGDGDFVPVPGRPTTMTIAHRLATITEYDKILVLGNGEVLEFGSPAELLRLEKGHFKVMVEEQNRDVD